MGCLKKIFFNILILIFLALLIFAGGFTFLKSKIDEFNNPPKEKVLKDALYFADFSKLNSDYKMGRTIGLFGYKKLTITHRPSSQKILFIKLPKNKTYLHKDDFKNDILEEKLQSLINDSEFKIVPAENLEIKKIGTLHVNKKAVNYAQFEADVDKLPFKNACGTVGLYNFDKNDGTVYIISIRDCEKYSFKILSDLIQEVDF